MPGEIWVTPRSCSECRPDHDDDGYGDDCDCWCHDAGAEDQDLPEPPP